MSKPIDVSKLSPEQLKDLQQQMKDREAKEKAAREAKRKDYEKDREKLITGLCDEARTLSTAIVAFKKKALGSMFGFRDKLLEYGDLRKGEHNKGSFEIKSDDDKLKIVFTTQLRKEFDERADTAEEHLKKFLNGFVKKRDQKLFEFIMSLLERNKKTGKLDISNINRLYAIEEQFDDADWKKALALFKESYKETGTAQYVRMYARSEAGQWQLINLDFASA